MTTPSTPQTPPEALRLAAWLTEGAWHTMRLGDVEAAGRELRRLHAENAALAEIQWVMAPPQEEVKEEQSVFEEWLRDTRPYGDAESVQRQWEESHEYRGFHAATASSTGYALKALNPDEVEAIIALLEPDHDGSDFEAECPSCTAHRKLTAMLSQPPAGQQDHLPGSTKLVEVGGYRFAVVDLPENFLEAAPATAGEATAAQWALPPGRGMVPMTVEKMRELYQMTQNAVNDLEAEDKYTFGAWFPIAVGFIEAAHGIGPSTQGVDHGS